VRLLLTGASGYIGGRLLRRLEGEGHFVRCLARRPEYLRARVAPGTEVVRGDVLDADSLGQAMEGIEAAFYLVHSMGSKGSFEEEDRRGARLFAAAAGKAGLLRIVYLGGLGAGGDLSPHLRSRQEVGEILRGGPVPVVELRASIILGSGSLSFDMIRALVEKLPVMVTPKWVRSRAQPIAVEDVVEYLVASLALPRGAGGVYEIGGAERVSYGDLMLEYARQRGLRRILLPVPFLSPRLSSLWLGLVTPLYARVGRKLIDSLRNDSVVTDDRALRDFAIRPRGARAAIERALANEDREYAETRWSDALSSAGPLRGAAGPFAARLVDSRALLVRASAAETFAPVRRIGGTRGWYRANALWRLRGFLDLLAGGPGLRRGRRDPERPVVGEPLDFWRVEAYEEDRLLRLAAEMRLPGRAWLQFEVEGRGEEGSLLRQTALFDPKGLLGRLYWYALLPMHRWIFRGMLKGIAERAVRRGSAASAPPGRDGARSATKPTGSDASGSGAGGA